MTLAKTEFEWYVVRRKDTGQYYKVLKSSYLKEWNKDDSRSQHWTHDVSLATPYRKEGIGQILALLRQTKHGWDNDALRTISIDPPIEVEIVTLTVRVGKQFLKNTCKTKKGYVIITNMI